MANTPAVRVYEATDGSGFATVYLDAKGRILPMFHISPRERCATAEDAVEAAVAWWESERDKQIRKKAGFKREAPVVPGVTHDAPAEPAAAEEDPFA